MPPASADDDLALALREAIAERTARLVVIGLGFVGLPVACKFAWAGFRVTGIDVVPERVAKIDDGVSPIEGQEPGLKELLAEVVRAGRLRATTDYNVCREAQIVLIAVETPVDDASKRPRYRALRAALTSLGAHLQPGTLVIVESTLAPGTMQRVVAPLLEETSGLQVSRDFYLAHCPERVMPGRLLSNLTQMSRVVGGMSPEAGGLAALLYRHVVQADLDVADALTAELVKTAENAYRDVQIAFANEVALLCESLGADVWQVRELVNKSPGRDMLLPGAGVGGHCIPKDPWLLIANAGDDFQPRLIPAARAVNDDMPLHVAELVREALAAEEVELADARVTVLGYAYLENADDTRNSPSAVLVERLRAAGAEVQVHDPWVAGYDGDLDEAVAGSDAVVLMVAHDAYGSLDLGHLRRLTRRSVLVDGRKVFAREQAEAAGFRLYSVGVGRSTDELGEGSA
jgi:UDP-N-acetyl-D-mannosaminuronic acid dehydrogenase